MSASDAHDLVTSVCSCVPNVTKVTKRGLVLRSKHADDVSMTIDAM